ncbi:hypothetical protein VTH82DRAFT_7184 [Thermothelomyces myriococcoides]
MLILGGITRSKSGAEPPQHHVASVGTTEAPSGWASYIPSWAPSPRRSRPSLGEAKVAGFRNPWPSWHRPTWAETWNSFRWGEDGDGCIELAASHLPDWPAQPQDLSRNMQPSFLDAREGPDSIGAKAARLLRVEAPDFSFPPGTKAKATWLGHAGVLVQLPPLDHAGLGRPVRALFDPLFGDRCSPSQFAGPVRSYPPPCRVQDLPPIDLVLISHNHFDHMDSGSILSVWDHSRDSVRFFVPLGNAKYLLEWSIPTDRVVELDWWDSADFTCGPVPAGNKGNYGNEFNKSSSSTTIASSGCGESSSTKSNTLRVHCTPAQHNSFRSYGDTNTALWSSWLLELSPTRHHQQQQGKQEQQQQPYRVFFGGDTGYQFHPDPSWPPSPNNPGDSNYHEDEETNEDKDKEGGQFPACPAFAEIRARIGAPHLLLLPVSVGATFSYLRSFFDLPLPFSWPFGLASSSSSSSSSSRTRFNPFPRHSAGVTGANHMPAWDAVRVLRVMAGPQRQRHRHHQGSDKGRKGKKEREEEKELDDSVDGGGSGVGSSDEAGSSSDGAVAVAMHWGTFVPDPEEVLRTLGSLEWACQRQRVRFTRELRRDVGPATTTDAGGRERGLVFVAPHHGASVVV